MTYRRQKHTVRIFVNLGMFILVALSAVFVYRVIRHFTDQGKSAT